MRGDRQRRKIQTETLPPAADVAAEDGLLLSRQSGEPWPVLLPTEPLPVVSALFFLIMALSDALMLVSLPRTRIFPLVDTPAEPGVAPTVAPAPSEPLTGG